MPCPMRDRSYCAQYYDPQEISIRQVNEEIIKYAAALGTSVEAALDKAIQQFESMDRFGIADHLRQSNLID